MTLFDLLEWVLFYSIIGAFIYIPIYSVMLTDTDWGWDHKVVAFILSYLIPGVVVGAVVGCGIGVCQFVEWSKGVTLW